MDLFSRYASASLLVAIASCNDPAAPVSSTLIGDNLIRLTTSASAREIESGSPVRLRITLTNEGTETVTLHFNSGCQIMPYLRDWRGADVIPAGGGWICTGALTELALAPGQSAVREHVWTGSTDFRSEMPLRPLPPGRYYFAAEVPAQEAKLRSGPIELILK
jgi:hypothetical protein